MPFYLDIHNIGDATPEEVARAHAADLDVQVKYGVEYTRYWMNESGAKLFCLCRAPNAEAATKVHQEAHGMAAEKVIEVDPDLVEGLMGNGTVDRSGAVLLPGEQGERDPGTRIILFTDIVDSTAFTQKYGDQASVEQIVIHDQIVRGMLSATEGREVKHTGDGIMASFLSADSAADCAVKIHQELARYSEGGKYTVEVRIGAAAGDPIEHNNDMFGASVQLAARLCAQAKPGQTLVSGDMADLCTKAALRHVGEVSLKGFDRPISVHAVE